MGTNLDIIEKTFYTSKSYWLDFNEFADMTWDEFAATHLTYKKGAHFGLSKWGETALKAAVSKQPVPVTLEVDHGLQLYRGGVLDNLACGTKLNHEVLIVGYGTAGGKDYWKVKNSWVATWGEQGYFRMVRNKNQCGR